MISRILEFDGTRVRVTPEAFAIPEIRAILDKFGTDAEPYLYYVGGLSYPDGPYIKLPEADRAEAAIYDIKETIGDFDPDDPILPAAIKRIKAMWVSEATMSADMIEEELHGWRKYLRNTPIGGEEMKNRLTMVAQFEKTVQQAANLRKIADDEINNRMKGGNEMGSYT